MKRIVNGVTYNTDTASVVGRYEWVDEGAEVEATVYQTRGGAFFIVHSPEAGAEAPKRPYIEATDRAALLRIMDWAGNFEIVDSGVLEEPPEGAAEASPEATVYARVPAALKRRLDEAARAEGQSVNAFVTRCLERCMGP